LDANVLVSGIAGYKKAESAPGEILRRLIKGDFSLVTSNAILTEVHRTLVKTFFRRSLSDEDRSDLIAAAIRGADILTVLVPVSGVASHPEDDLVLATAVSGAAEYLVTGDRQLLAVGTFHDVRLVTARQFLDLLGP
jgi:putative PIN family toxin of toxin-antitoxin system